MLKFFPEVYAAVWLHSSRQRRQPFSLATVSTGTRSRSYTNASEFDRRPDVPDKIRQVTGVSVS